MKELQIECPDCKGTGLYKGCCEKDDCAVVCTTCKGKGYTTYEYNEFTGKKVKEGIKRVFGKTCGFVHSAYDYKCEDGKVMHFSEYGCTYEEWLNGAEPRPMEELVCPYYYNNRGIGSEPFEKCRESIGLGNFISECKYYENKAQCWKELHDLQENEKHDIVEEKEG